MGLRPIPWLLARGAPAPRSPPPLADNPASYGGRTVALAEVGASSRARTCAPLEFRRLRRRLLLIVRATVPFVELRWDAVVVAVVSVAAAAPIPAAPPHPAKRAEEEHEEQDRKDREEPESPSP